MSDDLPYDWSQARDAHKQASRNQQHATEQLKEAIRLKATREKTYREALTKRLMELRTEGIAVTACGELARGEPPIATLRYERDVQDGIVEMCRQSLFRIAADRRGLEQLVGWSERVGSPAVDRVHAGAGP